jgi:hypothetical protein
MIFDANFYTVDDYYIVGPARAMLSMALTF